MNMNTQNLEVLLTASQLKKLNNRTPFQLSHSQLNSGGKGNHQINLSLTPKAYKKAMRHIKNNKGMRINPNNDIDGDVVYGGKIKWNKVAKIGKSIGKTATPILAPAIISGATYATGNPLLGVVANDVIQRGVSGAGFGKTAFGALKTGSKYVPKSLVNAGKKELVNQISQRTGSNLAGDLSNSLLSAGINETYGSGFGKTAFGALKTGSKYVPKSLVNAGKKELVNQISQRTGSNLAGDLSNSLLSAGINETYGSGFTDYLKTGAKYVPKSLVNAGKQELVRQIAKKNMLAADLASGVLTHGIREVYGGSVMSNPMAPNGLPHSVNPISRGAIKLRLKGSDEAKLHMAKVRAMRGQTNGRIIGGSFR